MEDRDIERVILRGRRKSVTREANVRVDGDGRILGCGAELDCWRSEEEEEEMEKEEDMASEEEREQEEKKEAHTFRLWIVHLVLHCLLIFNLHLEQSLSSARRQPHRQLQTIGRGTLHHRHDQLDWMPVVVKRQVLVLKRDFDRRHR